LNVVLLFPRLKLWCVNEIINKKGKLTLMNIIKTFSITLVLFLAVQVITGCNDESSSDSSTPDGSTSSSKITSSNAKSIAAAAFASADSAKGLPVRSGTVSRSDGADSDGFNYSEFVINQLAIIQNQSQLMGRSASGVETVTAAKALDCQLHITGDIAQGTSLSAGDNFSFAFDNCTYGADLIVNGPLGVTLTKISEDFNGSSPYELGIDVVLTDFEVTREDSRYASSGDISMIIKATEAGDTTTNMNGASLNVLLGASGMSSFVLTDYVINLKESKTGDYTVSQKGTLNLSIPFIRVSASFTTITPFSGNNIVAGNPTAGKLHLTGAASTQAWVIAQSDGVNVQIDIDVNGDEVVDETVMTTWSELQNFF
jgi:hypothetical protein